MLDLIIIFPILLNIFEIKCIEYICMISMCDSSLVVTSYDGLIELWCYRLVTDYSILQTGLMDNFNNVLSPYNRSISLQ